MGLRYDYNELYIEIPVDIMGASKIGTTGVVIGSAADYDRIANLAPQVARVNDKVSEVAAIGCPVVGDSSITIETGAKDVTLTKSSGKLKYVMA